MSEQAAPPIAGPQPGTRAALAPFTAWVRRAVSERGACGGGAGEARPAEWGEGPLEIDELAERSEAFR